MNTELHTDDDHHPHGARGQVVTMSDCDSEDAGSIPVAHPTTLSQRDIPRLRELFTSRTDALGARAEECASVAQVVEQSAEDGRVVGSTPTRGTKHKA